MSLHDLPTGHTKLSAKELEVLKWLAKGYTKIEVGERLNISGYTVDFHVRNILGKLKARNVVAAVYIAMSLGILTPE